MIAIGFLGVWEWLAHARRISVLLFPAPTVVVQSLTANLISGYVLAQIRASFERLFLGAIIGCMLALLLGIAMGWSRRIRVILDPWIAAFHPIPKIALLPLVMVFFGIGQSSKIVLIAASTFFPMLINTMAAVREIRPVYFDVARSFGARRPRIAWRIILPASTPLLLSGLRLSLNVGLVITVAIEMVASRDGLGQMIWLSWQTLRMADLFSAVLVIAIIGIGMNAVLGWLARIIAPWYQGSNG